MRAKKLLSRVISILLVITLLPVSAFAEIISESEADPTVVTDPKFMVTVSHVNPEYVRAGVKFAKPAADCTTYAQSTVNSIEEAAAYLCTQMEQRVNEVTIVVNNHTFVDENGLVNDWLSILYGAWEHTGVSTQGDYIARHYGKSGGGVDHDYVSVATFYYTIIYDTTIEQENAVGDRIDELFTQWDNEYDFYALSDYEQVKIIYDYICEHVAYDNDRVNDNSYTLKYSAYAALIEGIAACQGYANLFYRMALELGIDNRIVVGIGGLGYHAWNIVDMGEKYYYLDSTWDAGRADYKWFLLGSDEFCKDHTPTASNVFDCNVADYSIDTEDYVPVVEPDNLLEKATAAGLLPYFDFVDLDQNVTRLDLAKLIAALAELRLDPDVSASYSDCAELTDEEKQIIGAVEKFGVMSAYDNGSFRPFNTVNRATVALVLYRAMHDNVDAEDLWDYADDGYFGDVPGFTWYAPYVNYLASVGILPVSGDKKFYPNDMSDFRAVLHWMVNAVNSGAEEDTVVSGTCGDGVIWTLDKNGVLTIGGEGEITRFLHNGSVVVPWYTYGIDVTKIVIEEGVTGIGNSVFSGCRSLIDVTIPDSVTKIGDTAFYNCTSLACITIPDGVTEIGAFAFDSCSSLESASIGNGVTSIGFGAFSQCSSLVSVEIGDSLKSFDSSVFANCTSLANIELPDGMTSIGDLVFVGCSSLVSVHIPDSVTSIGYSVFSGCASLAEIEIPDGVTNIGAYMFSGCTALKSAVLGNAITVIGKEAFKDCAALETITLPESCTEIGESAFYGCTALAKVYYGGTEEQWGSIEFGSNNDLLLAARLIAAHDHIVEIVSGREPTCEETGLTEGKKCTICDEMIETQSEIPAKGHTDEVLSREEPTLTEPGKTEGKKCSVCEKILIEQVEIPALESVDGRCGDTLTWTLTNKGVLTIEGTGKMDNYVAGEDALRIARRLGIAIMLAEDATESAPWGEYIDLIAHVIVKNGVTGIGDNAFAACAKLKEIELPETVETIGNHAFLGCEALEKVTYTGTEEQWRNINIGTGNEAFEMSELVIINVMLGDLNGDGRVTGADTNLIFRYVSGTVELTERQLKAADVNGDDRVTGADTNLVFRYVSGTISSFE